MQRQDEIHPEDKRNLIIFIIAALAVWFVFDHYLLGPKIEKLREARVAAAQQATEKAVVQGAEESAQARPRETVLAESPRVKIDNGAVFGSVSLRGGRIDDLHLQNYYTTLEKTDHVILLSPAGTEHARYIESGWLASEDVAPVPDGDTLWQVPDTGAILTPDHPVTLSWDNGRGLRFERRLAIDGNYMFTVTERVTNYGATPVTLFPYSRIAQQGLPGDFEGAMVVHEGPLAYLNDELIEHPYQKMDKGKPEEEIFATTGWIGISDKYWFTSLIPEQDESKTFRFVYKKGMDKQPETNRYQTDVVGAAKTVGPGESIETSGHAFSGAKEVKLLMAYRKSLPVPHFDLAVDFGLYYFLTLPFFYILDFFGRMTGNFGIAIICLTVIMRLSVFPLANTSFRSFAKMKKISPMMKELRDKYGTDRVKLQEELVNLYEKEKVNPMSGCLPILIQIPIFFALFKILNVTIEMRHAPFFGWIHDLSARDPLTVFNLFGLIPWMPPSALMIGPWSCAMMVAMLVQRAMNPPPQDPTQAMMNNFMPFFITYLLSKYAVGLVIYWTFSNTLSVAQQYIIMRSAGVEVHFFGRAAEDKKMEKMVGEGPSVHPGLEVAEHKVEDALFGEHEGQTAVSPPKRKKGKKKG